MPLRRYYPGLLAVLLIAICVVPVVGQGRPDSQKGGGLRVVGDNARQGFRKEAGHCQAFAPQDWVIRSRPQGDTADLDGAGGRAHASWGMVGINTAMRQYYGDRFGPPDIATLAIISQMMHTPARWTSAQRTIAGFFTARNFEAGSSIGTVLYHAYPGPTPSEYILGSYFAWVDKSAAKLLPMAQAVMASIRCQTQLRPPEPSGPLPRPGPPHGKAKDESDSMKDYNVQLGTQWVHSTSTGKHYLLDYATQWNSNGPDGPGYYAKTGANSYEKLETGW